MDEVVGEDSGGIIREHGEEELGGGEEKALARGMLGETERRHFLRRSTQQIPTLWSNAQFNFPNHHD